MASVREYLEKMPTNQLEALLSQEAFGRDSLPLSVIYLICDILARREPVRNATERFVEFAGRYAQYQQLVISQSK